MRPGGMGQVSHKHQAVVGTAGCGSLAGLLPDFPLFRPMGSCERLQGQHSQLAVRHKVVELVQLGGVWDVGTLLQCTRAVGMRAGLCMLSCVLEVVKPPLYRMCRIWHAIWATCVLLELCVVLRQPADRALHLRGWGMVMHLHGKAVHALLARLSVVQCSMQGQKGRCRVVSTQDLEMACLVCGLGCTAASAGTAIAMAQTQHREGTVKARQHVKKGAHIVAVLMPQGRHWRLPVHHTAVMLLGQRPNHCGFATARRPYTTLMIRKTD